MAADPVDDPDTVARRIPAPADDLYDIVSDPTRMGELSPECTGGRWLDGATGPAVGARFKGTNKRGFARWSTTNTVVAADRGRDFAFETKQSGMRWRYRFEPDGDATIVTESREHATTYPLVARIFTTLALGGVDDHTVELREGMADTLARLEQVATGSSA
ncbi:MAG: SRPBCC family protein [Acidimicrobiales bacterium]|nr:SRPBCC family protein [Acidimicrobiales bacterium]